MNRYLFPVIIAALLFQVSPAFSDITWKATVNYMHPYDKEAREVSGGDWGLSGEMEFHIEGVPDYISWAGGMDWIDMLGERTAFANQFGELIFHELDQNYFRFWFGPRIRSHQDVLLRPYAGVNLSLIIYRYSSYFYTDPGGIRTLIEDDWKLATGYGADAGLEIRSAPGWSIDLGIKYLGTFGELRQLSFDSVTVHPTYLLYYLGVRFPMWEGL